MKTLETERKDADFSEPFQKGGYARSEAVFIVDVPASDGWKYLKKESEALERGTPPVMAADAHKSREP